MTALLQVDTAPQEFHPTPITDDEAAVMSHLANITTTERNIAAASLSVIGVGLNSWGAVSTCNRAVISKILIMAAHILKTAKWQHYSSLLQPIGQLFGLSRKASSASMLTLRS